MVEQVSGESTELVAWDRVPPGQFPDPIVITRPYVEVKLEHPSLEPSSLGESFFPDAVPYVSEHERRVFYWRRSLGRSAIDPDRWSGICATTHELAAVSQGDRYAPKVYEYDDQRVTVVVDGTIAGDSTTTALRTYQPPAVTIGELTPDAVTVEMPAGTEVIQAGDRMRIALPARRARLERDGTETTLTPRLFVRYPGSRTLYHPHPSADYRLFPSFGLDLDDVADPIEVPTTHDEIEPFSLAETLGVELPQRPYPERVLWQAFAVTAFDSHGSDRRKLTQFRSGVLGVES